MTLTEKQILILSLVLTGILVVLGFMKLLRSNRILLILTPISLVVGLWGMLISGVKTETINGNGAEFLIAPFVYLSSYSLLRMLYKKLYKVEPTYNRFSWYDKEEGRKQNWLDVTVHILPMVLGFFVAPIILAILFNKYA
ncbi:hypothetical protein [Robertkochia flava]|uniref:hypothetical protein n=1 Tax=Robertkochia flava TaxID=3447986 RepID=UPI001CCB5B27|nr:hypothetical protein [Robertkochia marina]